MKIKGVNSGKKKGSPPKGTPIEFTAEEKPLVELKSVVPKQAPKGEQWWVKSVAISALHHTPKDIVPQAVKKFKFANKAYIADGSLVVGCINMVNGKYKKDKKFAFHIEFEDIIDGMSQPCMKTTVLDLT